MVKTDCKLCIFERAKKSQQIIYIHRCQVYNWPFYAFLAGPLAVFYIFDWLFYIATLIMVKCMNTTPEGTEDTHRSTFNHVVTAMLLSLPFGIGWAVAFISSTDLSHDAYLITQYAFSILILAHAILQMILYLLNSHTTRKKPCNNTTVNEQRSSKIFSSVEGIDLEARNEKKPIDNILTSPTAPPVSHTTMPSPVGAGDLRTDDQGAVNSYTVSNEKAMEPSDEPNKLMSTF